ncbi:MAG: PAS domain S-box protein [Nitrospiraceae bacterium]|nr:MAG: PAS domain S-box protein [Nitrospiraceae bacterium]
MIVKDEEKSKEQLVSELVELRKWAKKLEYLYSEYEQALKTLRSFEKALETMQIGVTITDLQGNIFYINPADLEIHGYDGEDLKGESVRLFAADGNWNPLSMERIKSMKRWKRDGINRKKDGSTFPVHLMSDVVTNENGEPIGIITTCEDITDRKHMEQEIKQRVADLEKFYEMSIGREVKMKELKKEIERLKQINKK